MLISQWSKTRPIPLDRCVPIERATDGQVMRWDLRPDDWWEIWPELVCHPNAPEVPTGYVSSISVDDGLVPSPQGPGSFSGEVKCE
ncbi:MAG: transcriptional regulator [Limnobacter sp.]|uniref:transcriptional regulator n=1 Tax=Limnobacter sp. TaxID=2003368 RepID=UPI0039197315